ncbi:interleukin-12 receptor subunit beta-2 [Myiozetetes cayanensis]|uniref:interleukin-12 receptor subunit beta-2 n=1 Tax=Myiozetetes cayanensis TaxID=478635 RepID=UPI00215F5886|nr:interleukin-12 receptor subunit beta-2 [Myiozetetes cayanensis]
MAFAWIVPSAVWLVMHFTAEACRKGIMTSSKAPHGTEEICDKGTMTANTASAIQCGTNVTLSCHLGGLQTPNCEIGIFLNNSKQVTNSGRSVSKTFPLNTYGKHTFTCKRICKERNTIICGIYIKCGNPPDEPVNVSCIQAGTDSHPLCTWNKGRLTYLDTTYMIQLSNGTHDLCFSEESLNETFGSLALTELNFDSNYTIVVSASNKLGSASSQPLTFMLTDIVKPHPPDFLVEFDNSSATNCTLFWHNEAQAQHYRLRYRPLTRHSWSTVEIFSSEQYHLHGLEPDTAYEFQVSCKIHPERGLWSDWSTKQTRTPEAEPTGIPDVWYRLSAAQLGSQQQNISLFWKALSKSEAGGRILGYKVTFEALDDLNSPTESHQTTHTSYSRVTPRVGYKITVTAQNSRGSSPPASILTNLGIQDLPPPQQVSAMAMGNSSILVSWKPPRRSAVPISGYVVEWAETGMNPHLEPHHTWAKLPASNLSTVIAEHIKDNMCYQIHVFALYQDRAGQAASVRGYSTAQAPSAGPQMLSTPWATGVLVSWEEIPVPQQRGCITGYHVYLQSKDSRGDPQVYAIPEGTAPRSLYIPDLQPGGLYDLWVTGSTAAGEGPRGNRRLLCISGARVWVTVVLTCSFFIFSASVCFVPPARKAFHSLLSVLLPQCKNEAIPDPANATWAKSFMATKAQLSSLSILFLPSTISFEEPEPTLVEEAFEQPDPLAPGEKLLLGSAGSRGHRDWTRQSSSPEPGEEQQLPEMYQRLVVEATEHLQPVPEYITNPSTTDLTPPSDTTRDHPTDLPEYITSPGPTDLALPTDTPMDHPELECHPLSIFPTTFLAPTLCSEGNLTLDRVKLNCSSFPR